MGSCKRTWRFVLLACVGAVVACGRTGDDLERGAVADDGGTHAGTGGATSSGGARSSNGGNVATGGVPPAGGAAGTVGSGGTGGVTIDCSGVGCAPPPFCAVGCTDVCGCCSCADGENMPQGNVTYVCKGGCWYGPYIPGRCILYGRQLAVGESVVDPRGCVLICQDPGILYPSGQVCPACTGSEPNRHYGSRSSNGCPAIDFYCPTDTEYFSDGCGCGCAQDPECPPALSCPVEAGIGPCEPAADPHCPYSGP